MHVFLFLFLMLLCLFFGSVSLPFSEVWAVLTANASADATAQFIVLEVRLPQMLTALLSGAALGAGGLVMQTVFSNPLADPSLLGVNSGASLGVAIALLLYGGAVNTGWGDLEGFSFVVVAALVGAMFVIGLLTVCSGFLRGRLALLVAGVMISFVITSVISLLSFFSTAQGVQSYILWGLGDFSGVTLDRLPYYAGTLLLGMGGILCCSRSLNALLLGDDYAANLGVNVRSSRTILLFFTGVLTATVTALCGPISFIGLAVPHMARFLGSGANHHHLLPITMLWGANVALAALFLSRLPGEGGILPLSAITPLIGVPVVFYVLLRFHRI